MRTLWSPSAIATLLVGSSLLSRATVHAKTVFAHYMVGTVDPNTDHAKQDIDQAMAVGFDAFALNVGSPGADWATNTLNRLFDYANGKNFKLFLSFDFYGNGDISAHQRVYDQFKDHGAYMRYGPDNRPLVSSYSGGNIGPDAWKQFKNANNVFLLPNVEADSDYYNNPSAFWSRWGNAVDGVFSWETSWPDTSDTPVNVSSTRDERVKDGADAINKAYMMGLSSLQYKHCCGDSWYRAGEVNFPERMVQILSLKPEFTEVITWNDAGESHYIGPCWEEGLSSEILQYGNSKTYPHDGWQPLISSFIDAYRNGRDASAMKPPADKPIGAMWYRGVLKSCQSGESLRGAGAAVDAVNYAVVISSGTSDLKIRVTSGGRVLSETAAHPGLNYNSVAGMGTGSQQVAVVRQDGSVVVSASSAVDVSNSPQNGFCNFNYYVNGLK